MTPGKRFSAIETARLVLRRFTTGDALPFYEYRTLPEIALYQSEGWLSFSLDDADKFVSEQAAGDPGMPDSWFQIAIERKDSGLLIGDLGLHTLSDVCQAEIGFTIAPAHQHQGFAFEAARALINYLFSERGLHQVLAVADARNIASLQLIEKLGMHREGSFCQNPQHEGHYSHEYQYALLKEEYWASPFDNTSI